MLTNNAVLRTILAVLVPFALMTIFVLVAQAMAYLSGWAKLLIGTSALVICPTVGFLVLIMDSKLSDAGQQVVFVRPSLRRYSIGIALLYFPVMFALLSYFGLFLAALFFGDTI